MATGDSAEVPDIYCDGIQMGLTPFDAMLWLMPRPSGKPPKAGQAPPEVQPTHVGTIRMSLEQAKVFPIMLRKNLKNFEDQTGKIPMHPELMKSLGISSQEDW